MLQNNARQVYASGGPCCSGHQLGKFGSSLITLLEAIKQVGGGREAVAFGLSIYLKMKYRLRVNGNEYFVASSQELKQLLNFAKGQFFVDVDLTQIHEPERKPALITRLLAPLLKLNLSSLYEDDEISALIDRDLAVVFYIERGGNMFHSVDADYTGPEDSMVDFHSIAGDQIQHPRKKTVSTEKAIKAILRFYEEGKRPDSIQWAQEFFPVE